ncbi:purple acid phosphatase, partial [Haematococcus lacustris]
MLQYVMGSTYTVSEDDMCSGLAQQTPFTVVMHVVQLTSLLPGWRHHYRIEGSSRVHEFQAPPARTRGHGSNAAPVSFIAYGDMGEGVERPQKCPMAAATVAAVQDEIARKPVSVGNHEYDFTGSTANDLSGVKDSYHPKWGNFGDDSGGECGAMVARRFSMPSHPSFNSPFWYAFDYGSVHFTMISTEHDISPGSRQYKWVWQYKWAPGPTPPGYANYQAGPVGCDGVVWDTKGQGELGCQAAAEELRIHTWANSEVSRRRQGAGWLGLKVYCQHPSAWLLSPSSRVAHLALPRWLEADLAGVDRCKTPWVVVGMHRPQYVVYPHKDNRIVADHLRDFIEDLMLEYNVDITIAGGGVGHAWGWVGPLDVLLAISDISCEAEMIPKSMAARFVRKDVMSVSGSEQAGRVDWVGGCEGFAK